MDKINWKELAKELYDHLNYYGWGDSWECEYSKNLQEKAANAFDREKQEDFSKQGISRDNWYLDP